RGAIMSVPSAADAAATDSTEATRIVRMQAADWRSYRDRVAGSAPAASGGASRETAGRIGTAVAETTPAAPPGRDQLKVSRETKAAEAPAAESKAAETKTPPVPPVQTKTPVREPPGFFSDLLANMPAWAIVAGALAILAGIAAFVAGRRRKATKFEDSIISGTDIKTNTVFGSTGGGVVNTGENSLASDFSREGLGNIDTDEVDPIAE